MDRIFEMITKVKNKARQDFVPIVRDETLKTMLSICKEEKVKSILEIGTATGYSALNLLTVAENVVTIEKNEGRFEEAKNNFAEAHVDERVKQYLGDAGEVLEKLCQSGQKFDLIFLDGPKGQYKRYLQYIIKLLGKGGILFADNILLGGLIYDDSRVNHKNRAMVKNMRTFLEEIKSSKDFESQIFEIEDGFAICKKL